MNDQNANLPLLESVEITMLEWLLQWAETSFLFKKQAN